MRGMATLPQGYQELLVVRDKVGRLPGELELGVWIWIIVARSWRLSQRKQVHGM